ncbi:MAG: KEOPS complex subunit Cgi121 [Methanoculleus sp.]|jgi:KEOPS complex subunit Cgi121|nr:KEOPS complex subunit Cgi121 [Methanoculleus sp.]
MAEPACDIYQAVFTVDDSVGFLREVREAADACGTHIILFDADHIAGRDHVTTALRHACRSWTGGEAIANSIEMEALLYAAGTRQCQVAATFGIHPGENRSYIAVCPPAPGVRDRLAGLVTFVDGDWEELDPAKRARLASLFSITAEEIAVVGEARFRDLVLERVALLDVYR